MTLIEVLISVVILGIIIGPLTMVLFFGVSTGKAAIGRTTDSSGAQLLSAYLVSDVQSADTFWTPGLPAIPATCATSLTRLELQGVDAASGSAVVVTYDLTSASPGANDNVGLQRVLRTAGTCAIQKVDLLAPTVDPATPPLATCDPATCTNVRSVKVQVTALSRDVHAKGQLYTPYTYSITATRRSG